MRFQKFLQNKDGNANPIDALNFLKIVLHTINKNH